MVVDIKEFIQELIDDLDIKIQSKETEQEQYDPLYQNEQFQFIAGEVEAYTHIQEVFCSILENMGAV